MRRRVQLVLGCVLSIAGVLLTLYGLAWTLFGSDSGTGNPFRRFGLFVVVVGLPVLLAGLAILYKRLTRPG